MVEINDYSLVHQANDVESSNWEDIQELINQASDERAVRTLTDIMTKKFNENEELQAELDSKQ